MRTICLITIPKTKLEAYFMAKKQLGVIFGSRHLRA